MEWKNLKDRIRWTRYFVLIIVTIELNIRLKMLFTESSVHLSMNYLSKADKSKTNCVVWFKLCSSSKEIPVPNMFTNFFQMV